LAEPGDRVLCVDFGSTFTKAVLVDLETGEVVGATSHRTTIPASDGRGDVLDGLDACRAELGVGEDVEVLACSSAGGGLRIAVLGNEELVTAEAGRRVALSSGGMVAAVIAQSSRVPERALERTLEHTRPDVLLLTGGTDGGNAESLLAGARLIAESGWRGPVVVAGDVEARDEASAILADVPHVLADNVVPRIGVLAPESARAAIREMFLAHVIGGKALSSRGGFTELVQGPTPDLVLTGVEVLARVVGDVAVVDVGGATTDVHSVVTLDPEEAGLSREVVAVTPVTRTVEGDLGMRWSAPSTAEAAQRPDLESAARRRQADPGYLPEDDAEADLDEQLAQAAVGLALRRHAGRSRVVVSPEGRVVERTGKDLREVDLLVCSGGIFRHGRPGVSDRVLAGSVGPDLPGGWQLPARARVVIDQQSVLAAVGLLSQAHPGTAYRLAERLAH
jgi:uncharacterized protein (TIGR01319 family)